MRELTRELETLRLGGPPVFSVILPRVRALLELESMLLYAPVEEAAGWAFERIEFDALPKASEFLARARGFLARAPRRYSFFDPFRPEPAQRNRLFEARAWIERTQPGAFEASPLCRELFAPLHLDRHRQVRSLICEGPSLLAWFGSLHDGPVDRRQLGALAALIPVVRRRLAIERRLAGATRTARALELALDRIGAPAFVVTARGAICEANAAARVLLDGGRAEVTAAIAAARAGRPHPLHIELTPVTATGEPDAWLAIARAETPDARTAHAVGAAAARWSLTPRQRAVLEHVVRGDATATIAAHLNVSTRAVELHVTALFDRAGIDSRAALVAAVLTR